MMISSWKEFIEIEKQKKYFQNLSKNIDMFKRNNKIFPPKEKIFNAFKLTPLQNVKVVILGQDPYHQVGQANGLAFSVNQGIKLPPSLQNIFKELKNNTNLQRTNGDLSDWAKQGVLLLNTILTVNHNQPLSHKGIGWEIFTNKVIKLLDDKIQPIFVLWGKQAQEKEQFIKNSLVIKSSHPSPYSANISFFNSKPFSKINNFLKLKKQKEIIWVTQ